MQFGSGKTFLPTFIISALIAAVVSFLVCLFRPLTYQQVSALFSGLYGTALLASAFSPHGLVPPQGSWLRKIQWFFTPQGATPLYYNRPAYYIGLLLLAVSLIINAVSN
jgi:hypothetical protein